MFKCILFPSCYLCTYEPAGKMDCITEKEKGQRTLFFIMMFHCMHTKFISGHYDDIMLVSVNNAGVYVKEDWRIIVFTMLMVVDIIDTKILVEFALTG